VLLPKAQGIIIAYFFKKIQESQNFLQASINEALAKSRALRQDGGARGIG
jgi:hypothetical protein